MIVCEARDWFVFRGERDYLHSTSLFDCILAEYAGKTGAPQNIDFTFIHKTNHTCRVEENNQGEEGLVATYIDDNDRFYLYETDQLIKKRVHYSEPGEGDCYSITGSCASIPEIYDDNSFIELAVGAYKRLLTSVFPEFSGKYVFARMKLDRVPDSSFEICYKRKVAKHFFEGEIKVGGAPVGLIYFGV